MYFTEIVQHNKIIKFVALFIICFVFQKIAAEAVPVELTQNPVGNWQLLRNGKPYFIEGAGGNSSKEMLAAAGANSFRTWGVSNDLEQQLDEAQKLGLAVVVGHWLGHERHGFNYNDEEALKEQFRRVKEDVLKYKDHPAVLLWSIGNEMEGFAKGDNEIIWKHVQDIAEMIKEIDPNHPTMAVTAEIGGKRVEYIHRFCPDIDILGINSYGGVASIPARYRELGGTKPYIITEFGPPGVWECAKTDFGAPLEPNSTQKAEFYRNSYETGISGAPEICLGSFAFTWGSKVETTSTWFGMFLSSGEKLATVDVMTELWSDEKPENLCPEISSFKLLGSNTVQSGKEVEVILEVLDPEGAEIQTDWMICIEPTEYLVADQTQWAPLELDGIITSSSNTGATLKITGSGIYRLYLTAYDGSGGAATINIPIQVIGESGKLRYKMPLYVYSDGHPEPWFYSGWMGNHKALTLDAKSTNEPHSGKTCMKISYDGPLDWVGVVWQHPANDWGDKSGGYDLTGAKKLTFWVKGEMGGELINFGVGIIDSEKEYYDTAKGELKNIKLKSNWKKYTIKLKGKDLSRIKTPFYWSLVGSIDNITFYLDDIRFE